MKIPKILEKKYNVEIDGDAIFIHDADGYNMSCISIPINEYTEIEDGETTWIIRCKSAVVTLQKNNHSFHLTIFS